MEANRKRISIIHISRSTFERVNGKSKHPTVSFESFARRQVGRRARESERVICTPLSGISARNAHCVKCAKAFNAYAPFTFNSSSHSLAYFLLQHRIFSYSALDRGCAMFDHCSSGNENEAANQSEQRRRRRCEKAHCIVFGSAYCPEHSRSLQIGSFMGAIAVPADPFAEGRPRSNFRSVN